MNALLFQRTKLIALVLMFGGALGTEAQVQYSIGNPSNEAQYMLELINASDIGAVSASDIGQTKSVSGQVVSNANFRADVNANGSLNASDIGQVKSTSGTALP